MNKIKFSKMQSLGNDFIVIYETAAISEIFNFKINQIRKMADRKKGIGADQILLVKKLDNSEEKFQYKIFNADGGEVELVKAQARVKTVSNLPAACAKNAGRGRYVLSQRGFVHFHMFC